MKMQHVWMRQHRISLQGTTMALVGTLLLSSCLAAPFLVPIAIEFAKNLLQTGLSNYGSKHRDNLSNLVNRMASPYMQNLQPMAGGGPGMPGQPGFQGQPGMPQQQYPGQQTYPGQAGAYDPNNPYGTAGSQNPYGQPTAPYGTPPGYAGQPGMPQQQYPGQQAYPGQPGAYDPNNPYGTAGSQNPYGQPTAPYGMPPGYAGQPGMPQQQYPGQQTYPGQAGACDPNPMYGGGPQKPCGQPTAPYGTPSPYGQATNPSGTQNPYGSQNPYGGSGYPPQPGQPNPYGNPGYPAQPGQANPYGTPAPYGQQGNPAQPGMPPYDPNNPYGAAPPNPYGQQANPYGTPAPYGQQGNPAQSGIPSYNPNNPSGSVGTPYPDSGQQAYPGQPQQLNPANKAQRPTNKNSASKAKERFFPRSVPSEPVAVEVALVRQKQTAKGKEVVLMNDGDILHDGGGKKDAGDKFKLVVRTNCDCYVYIVAIDGSAWAEPVFPAKTGTTPNPLKKDQEVAFPEGPYWFSLDQVKGIETFYVVASANRRTDLEESMAKMAAETRPASTIVAKVEEPPVIPRGVGSTSTRGIITVKDEAGSATQVTPVSYLAGQPGQDVTVTRWFKHE